MVGGSLFSFHPPGMGFTKWGKYRYIQLRNYNCAIIWTWFGAVFINVVFGDSLARSLPEGKGEEGKEKL